MEARQRVKEIGLRMTVADGAMMRDRVCRSCLNQQEYLLRPHWRKEIYLLDGGHKAHSVKQFVSSRPPYA